MSSKLYVVIVRYVSTPMTPENIAQIDKILGTQGDWLRFSGSNWLIFSERTPPQIYATLSTFLKRDDNELVFEIDPYNYSGWSPKWIDDWIIQRRPPR